MNYKHYILDKETYSNSKTVINTNKIDGYKLSPKNTVDYPGVEVNSMMVIKPTFIEKLLKKKIKRKLDFYLNYILNVLDDADSNPDDAPLRQALDDLSKYKEIVDYKYRKYLDDKYINLLQKKISLLEREIKAKIVYKQMNNYKPIYEEKGKSR